MPWSIFTDGGGPGAAYTWAVDLLKKIGAPQTAGNEQFVYDWERAEGGGGKFNPLNQGPVAGHPELTSTGPQYGGGAADYVSWSAGLQGAADYLAMPSFVSVWGDLRQNNPAAARADLIASPWAASHYGGGATFPDTPLPGHKSALPPGGGSASSSGASSSPTGIAAIGSGLSDLNTSLKTLAIVVPLVVGGAALVVWGFGRMTGTKTSPAAAAAKIGEL
jgi:hypothetical protein